jgi:hypothetical protein
MAWHLWLIVTHLRMILGTDAKEEDLSGGAAPNMKNAH